jgi:phage shock protein PspC (stress-responsive transcriptional regulator)
MGFPLQRPPRSMLLGVCVRLAARRHTSVRALRLLFAVTGVLGLIGSWGAWYMLVYGDGPFSGVEFLLFRLASVFVTLAVLAVVVYLLLALLFLLLELLVPNSGGPPPPVERPS